MRGLFLNIAALLDRITRAACMVAVLLLVAAVLTIVVLRYGFGVGYIGLQDFANYSFAILLALSVPVAFRQTGTNDTMKPEKRLFAFSIIYLFALFAALVADRVMANQGWIA